MRAAICFYSGSGNTRLACGHLSERLGIECDLIDVTDGSGVDLSAYDIVGLAASADFGGIPQRFESFLAELPTQSEKPAFVLSTYGFMNGRTLVELAERATGRGLTVLRGHALRMPESYPPMRSLGLAFDSRPNKADLRRFGAFGDELRELAVALARGVPVSAQPVRLGLLGGLRPATPRTTARDDMGEKFVDAELCTQCGTCAKQCPYGAITLSPDPLFDVDTCFGCWRCYNQCPQHAIYTKRFHGGRITPGLRSM